MPVFQNRSLNEVYRDTYAFLCTLERFGILLGLENMTRLLDVLGNPQLAFPAVHVAGSNGKGSTAAFITGILRESGLKAALYTSPHLNDFRERIRINGSMVSKEAVIRAVHRTRTVYDPERTTFFEFTTAVAHLCMAEAKPDIAVIEVGLGGRLDATNILNPVVTVITDISMEHEDYLGDTIPAIAREKAGIIKPGVPLVTAATRPDALQVIRETAAAARARMLEFGRDFIGVRTAADTFTYRSDGLVLEGLKLGMVGGHQVKNAALACAAVEALRHRGYDVDEEAFRRGIESTQFPGRIEVLHRKPDVIIDAAHTPEGMRLLRHAIRRLYPGVKPYVLVGMLAEKKWREMASIIATVAREFVCVAPQSNRALDPEALAGWVRDCGVPARTAPDIVEGFRILRDKASPNDVILAAGSLYMIGPVRDACISGHEPECHRDVGMKG